MSPYSPLRPTDLGLILTYKCQCACAHCLYNCGPEWDTWSTPAEVQEALEATQVWDHRFQVHITGGEPFLNFPLLLHAVETATELGIPCYVETNAGWCVRESLVTKQFTSLRQAGLQAILISCSPFHAETVPPKRTLLAIQIALDVFGPQGVIVYLSDWLEQITRFGLDEPSPLERYEDIYGSQNAGRLFWQGYGLIPGGRAGYRLGHLAPKHPAQSFRRENCRTEILYAHHSHFDLYGNYISGFCGGLTVGDWHNLPNILDDFEGGHFPRLIATLIEAGPYGLLEMAQRDFQYAPLADGYVGKCHLCVDVRRHLAQKGNFEALKPPQFYDMV